jgi:hypothetical protein
MRRTCDPGYHRNAGARLARIACMLCGALFAGCSTNVLRGEEQAVVDYRKLDAALAAALNAAASEQSFDVFIHVDGPLNDDAKAVLQRAGVKAAASGTILTASLSAQAISDLSSRPWVRQITLARPLRPLRH